MEIEIIETLLISPSPPPPLHGSPILYPLSHLDTDTNLNVSFRTLPLPRHLPRPRRRARRPPLPPLRRRAADARLELRLPSAAAGEEIGVPLTRAATRIAIAARVDSAFLDRLVPEPGAVEGGPDGPARPLALQVTQFACGGFALGMCVHHAMCDGAGATKFLCAVARLARGLGGPPVDPVWDRSTLLGPRKPPRVELPRFNEIFDFDERVASRGPYDAASRSGARMARECFHVSNTCAERLRNRLVDESPTGSRLTTFEALSAFIWRARVRTTGTGSNNEIVKMVYSMNISKILNPPLPAGYWGNVCVPAYVRLTAGELAEQPLSKTAVLIRESKRDVTDEYVRSYIDFQELNYARGITAGGSVAAFTDWRRLGHSEVDFGWGGPVDTLPLSWKLLGSVETCFFMPYGATDERKDEGFRVLVSLPEKSLPSFKVEMETLSCS
ncbi:spermidine sinapoyl-CoA acyltransferase-like [Ananas comosus]|uniref:Spermidine sinapoyl-CoA acyltransferase-like n=1 Tax=Ananas comosus TaxID=4615 RepID=A0A6P5ECW6_ANACO|nr:spermidine sinapoyl-CoA acyltransferase-like [Ananas comosus]